VLNCAALSCGARALQLSKQLQRLQQRLSRSSVEQGSVGAYDSPTSTAAAAAAAADAFKPGPDILDPTQLRSAAAADDGPFAAAGMQYPPSGAYVSKAYGGAGSGVDCGQVPARGWYLHACVVMAALGVRWWLLNQTDPLQRKVMLVIIWPVRGNKRHRQQQQQTCSPHGFKPKSSRFQRPAKTDVPIWAVLGNSAG
jgi:hypothetical protein